MMEDDLHAVAMFIVGDDPAAIAAKVAQIEDLQDKIAWFEDYYREWDDAVDNNAALVDAVRGILGLSTKEFARRHNRPGYVAIKTKSGNRRRLKKRPLELVPRLVTNRLGSGKSASALRPLVECWEDICAVTEKKSADWGKDNANGEWIGDNRSMRFVYLAPLLGYTGTDMQTVMEHLRRVRVRVRRKPKS